MPNLNLSDAWKDIPAPQPDADHAPMPDPAEQEIPATSPITPPGKSLLDISLPAPGDLLRTPPAVSSSPQPPKSIFDTPLPQPGHLLKKPRSEAHSSSLKYQPDSSRLETLHAMLLSRHNDPELDAVLEKNPTFRTQATLFDDSLPAKAAAAEQILRELTGEKNTPEPGLYFLANKEKLPQVATRQEALAAVYDHYTAGLDKRYQENKKRRADYQANRTSIEAAVPRIVAGLLPGNQLQTVLTPEQISIYNKEFDPAAVSKAAAAFAILKKTFAATSDEGLRNMVSQRTAMQITSVLSDDDGTGKLTISEPAYALFETSLKKLMDDVKEQSGNEWSAWHNLKLALFNPAQKADASLATGIQLSGQQQLLVPFDKKHNKIVFGLSSQTIRDYQTYVKNDQENSRILGLLSTGQDLGNQTSDTAPFGAKVVNCLGSVAGQTAPFFIPYAGWGLALASAYDDKRNRAYYEGLEPGTAEWSAFVDAAASTAVEKISFGAIGKLSRAGSLLGKLPFAAKAQQTLTSSLWKRILFETGAGIAEETIAEPTAEAIIQWAIRNNLAPLAGLDVGKKYNWDNYWQELSGMLKPEQLMATALFVGGLAGLQAPSLRKAMETYSRSPEMIQMQGVARQDAERIAKIDDPAQRIQAIQEAQKKVQETDPAQVQKNAADGLAAFRSFAEVKATVESEAYKIYQKERHLPQVEEKLDQPGTYTITTYDKETGNPASTQEVTADQLASLFGQHITVQEKEDIGVAQSMIAANAYVRTAQATGQLQTQDMLQWGQEGQEQEETKQTSPAPQEKEEGRAEQQTDPAETKTETETENHPAENITTLGKIVRATGTLNQQTFTYLANIATQEYTRRTQSGMTEQEALQTPFSGLSPYVPLVSMIQLDAAFQQRLKIAENTTGEEAMSLTRLFKMRTSPGSTPADTLLMLVRGNVGSREALEDLFEWKLDSITQGNPARLQTVGALLRDTQTSLHKLGFTGQFITPDGPLAPMQIVEAMSKLALSDTLTNSETLPLPQWQKDLLQYHINTLGDADYLINLGNAWNEGRQKGTVTDDIADILRDLGHQVHSLFDQAKIEQQDIQAWRDAQAIVNRRDPSGSPTATQIRQQQKQDAQAERSHITTTDSAKRLNTPDTPNPSGQDPANAPNLTSDLPPSLQQVFPAGASYNPAAQTWLGMVPVDKLRLSPEVPQVKVNSGKKGVVNPLVGDYRADAPPIYVWKRNNGRLEVVSGRHRLDLAQRTGTENIAAYVYEEDTRHDAQWARLLDYEQNMQDDQADELTAAIYVRETRLSDDELTRRGLTRSGTKSRRGLLIGREAREDLWTRFKSTAIKAQDAEAICLLTQYIQNKDRIDAIQATAASDLANGKTLDFIAAKIQLMIHAAADGQMVQGLISFGETFEADMEKAAEYVSRCIGIINDHINAIKGVRTISKKSSVLATEGITAGLSADPAERLKELELLKTMYEKIGLYENLRLRAFTWDGHTQPDPIGDHRLEMQSERAKAEEEAAASQEEENRKASEALTPGFGFSLTTSRSPESTFNALWKQAAKELNTLGSTSFALNGQRVALHTISHDNFTQALDLGGMPNPAIQIADIHSGPTHYAEIACILHPDLIDPAKTPGARIWQGDSWTRMMPEKVTEDGDSWEDEDRTEKDTPWFYDENGDLLEWNRDNLDQYMKFKHLGSYLPHNMTIDDVLDNYGEEGGAFPLVLASQAYAVEFDSIRQAAENDNHAYQIDRQAAEIALNDLQNQFNALITSYFLEPRSLQKFIMRYWQKDTFPETVAQALINEGLLDDPGTHYDEDTEEYDDLRQTNESTAEEVADFIIACRTSAKPYYEAAHGGWLSPSDFTGFIIPTHLEETLRPQLEQRGLPIYTYDLTQEEANLLNNPWLLTKKPWLKDDIDERRNDAIRDFLEDNDVTFSLIPEDSRATSQNLTSTAASPLGLRPVAIAAAWNEVGQSEPVAIPIPRETEADQQGYSKLARTAFISLRAKTRQKDSLPQQSIRRREELAKPFLRTADNRTIFLGERDWSRFISSSPDARTLAAMSTLESLITTARYIHTVPEFDASPGNQIKARHYYLGKTNDPSHGTSLVLLTLREDTRGTYLEFLEAEQAVSFGKKNGSASSLTDFGLIHRAARRSLPASTLHTISQFVNHIDEQGRGVNAFLAPNGQPTNLTPDQWFLTRTKPFLDYFGDWLRDPSHASVVLDENGEPLICHRGLKKNYNPGVIRNYTWVSSSRSLSEEYAAGGTILDLFISARRPFHFPDGLTRLTAAQFRQTLKAELARETAKGKITPAQSQSASAQFDSLIHGDKETESFKIWEHYKEIKDILAPLGYDAVATEEGGVMTYGLFRPGQAKSSTGNCGTYDITIPDITFSLSPEENRIAQQAKEDGTWLRAPNGNASRLDPKLWATVRTRAFLNWFGDWIHDPEHASRAVDDNGEPMLIYHGSNYDFTEFDPTLAGENFDRQDLDNGFLFTSTNSNDARKAAESAREYQNQQNMDWDSEIPEEELFSEDDYQEYILFANTRNPLVYDLVANENIFYLGIDPTEPYIWDDPRFALNAQREFHEGDDDGNDYDAILLNGKNSTWLLARQSKQLKSAYHNRGTFDPTDPDITFSLSPEKINIVQQAKEEGSWLMAPNGQPSRLTENQWIQVRTKAFKDWFGDWVHDPEHASRVTDENGEPLIVYHGTSKAGFTVFDNRKGRPYSDTPESSHFFTSDSEVAASYSSGLQREPSLGKSPSFEAPGVYPCFLNLRSPLEEDFEGDWWDNRGEPWYDLYDHETKKDIPPPNGEEYWKSEEDAIQYAKAHGITDYMLPRASSSRTTHTVVQEAIEGGHDGTIIRNIIDPGDGSVDQESDIYVVLRPEQIKSATQNRGTFDVANPDITFSLWDGEEPRGIIPRSIASLSVEELLIIKRAKKNGTWLMAPNGEKSRLTEKQWAQVRTKAFREWFGDWLNDPSNAAKTIDSNGEPLVMYHGGSFDVRDKEAWFDGVPVTDGIFFSDSPQLAKSYQSYQAGEITSAWVALKTPFLAQNEQHSRLPWVDEYIDYWQEQEGWTDPEFGESLDKETVRDIIRECDLYRFDDGERWHDFLRSVYLHHDGFLGHDPSDMGAWIAVAAKSNQIKSAEYNNGNFDASHRDITFSLSPSLSNLAAVHSISPDKLLAADQLGGLPLPSIAVTRLDKPYTWGGESSIYLVGSPSLADPARGVHIHDRDMWSGVFPELRWNKKAENEREELAKQVEAATLRYAGENTTRYNFFRNALEGNHKGEMENKLRRTPGVHAVFAAERGYAPRPKTKKTESRLLTGDRQFWKEILNMRQWEDAHTLPPEHHQDFLSAMERAMERFRQKTDIAQDQKELSLVIMQEELKTAREDDYHKLTWFALNDARYAGQSVPDQEANEHRFDNYIAKHQKAFNAWVQDKIDRWFDPMPRIRENGQQATLDNITEYMLGRKRISSEKALTFSKGLLRAKRSRRFTTLDQIKKQRDDITTTEEHKQSIETANSLIQQFQSALDRIVNNFTAYDNAVEALSRVKGTPTRDKIADALAWIYYGSPHVQTIRQRDSLLDLGVEALQSLKEELRDYFEGVPRRAVLLDEFTHAILPETLKMNQQVRQILKRHKIKPLFHDGTLEDRTRTMTSLIGSDSSFSLAPNESRGEHSGNDPAYLRILSADFMETLSEEELTIVQTAMEQGTYLLAPNGQPSRLTPRQWVQVRTKAFKNWFGDWQTDIWNSSRVTDRNGEPLVVYHGSRHAGFTSFDSSKGKISSDAPFGTTFFSDNPAVAFSYSGDLDEPDLHNPSLLEGIYSPPGLYPCFLNLREPWGVDFEGAYWDGTGQSLFEFYDNETEEFITPPSGEDFWSSEKVIREYALEHGYTNYEIYNSEGARTTNTIVQDALNMGLDGAVICNVIDMGSRGSDHLESNIYVAFRPEQIKSATQNRGTFDAANPDITFSVIGTHAETWGNYKDKTFEGRDDGKLRAEIDTSQASLLRERPERDMTSLLSLLNTFKTHTPETNLIGSPVMKLYRNTVEFDEYFKNSGASQEERDTLYKAIMEEYGFDREAKQESSSALENSIRELTAPCRQVHQALLDALEKNTLTAKLIRASRNTRPVYQGVEETILAFLARGEDRLFLDALREAGEWKTYRLENVLDFPELFAAYPSMRDINIVFQDQIPNEGSGFFRKEDNTIVLRTPGRYATPSDLLSTILHEIQHVIQTIEGYARGGSPEGAARLFFSAWEDRLKKLRTYADSLSPTFVSLYQAQRIAQAGENPPEGTELQKQFRRAGSSITAERKRRLITRYLKNELDQVRQNLASQMTEGIPDSLRFPAEQLTLPTAEATLADEGKSLWKIILQAENLRAPLQTAIKEATLHLDEQRDRFAAMGGQIGAYRRLAGEIEARNVPHRMYWSATNRTQTPFNDTLEYPGEAITSFSLTSLKQIVSSLSAPTMQATRAAQLVKDFDAAAENWRRVMSAKEDQPGSRTGAELFGVINSLLSSARYVLPHGYRSRVHLMMQWASVYAAMAETGEIPTKGTLQTSDTFYKKFMENVINDTSTAATEEDARQIIAALGNKRLDRTMGKILDRVRDQLVYFAKDELREKTMKRVEAVYPKKEPGKKSPRGRMEAEAYRNLASYRKMLDSSAEYKAQAMTLLESQYENEQDETALAQCERDILAWKTYGDYKGMSLPQAQAAMEKLIEYILTGRNAWDRKIEQERSRTKYTARRIAQNLPRKNSATSRAIARIAGRTRLRKCLASLPYNFMSYSHLMLALEPILGQRFSRARIQDITDANAALLNESNDRAAWLSATIRETANLKTESQAEQWLVNFDTPEKTGIILMPEITLTTALTIEQAQDWLSLTKEQRAERRQEIRLRDERTETLTENIPQEEDIPLLQDALAAYLARSEAQRDRQQVITVERTVPNEEAAGPLTCSRDCALFAILLHEQKDYADQYDEEGNLIRKGFLRREGFDDEGIAALYEFVGSIGLTYGYALRKKLNDKGHTLAQIYEQRMGVPFTLKENYFRASFDRNSTREKDALVEPKSALGGGKYGLLIDRINHNENLDWSKSATLVFLAATAEQDNYIYTSHITADWRTLLRNKQLEQKLRQHLGEDIMGKISGWMDLIDGASLENNRAFLHLSRMQGMLQRAFAISVLSGNGYVLLKQSSAILHGFHAGWVPSAILEKADGARELAHRHITFSRYLYHLAASKMGMGAISLKTLAATPYFTARMRKQGHILAQIGNQMPGQQYSRFEKPQEWAMGRIEVVDVKANLHAMHALVNAYYAAARELNDKADSPFTDDQLRQAAINQVGQSLELGAQPLTKTQKSMSQAAGGILSKLAFVMKSEQLNKLGLMAAEWKTGSARNRVCAAQSWLALGVTSSLLAWFIAWLKGMDDEEDDETKLKKYAVTALLGDLTTIPLAGEAVNTLASLVTGERVFADSYARTLIDVGGITRTTKKEYQHLAGDKEMEWDAHFHNLTALVRFSGVGGTLSRSTSPVLSSYGALSLSAATGANLTRTSKDLLTHAFRAPDKNQKNRNKKKGKANSPKKETDKKKKL